MTPENALPAFYDHLDAHNLSLETLTLADGLAAVISFYRTQRFDDCDLDADGDMLLFQWGGEAPLSERFAVDITRQLIFGNTDDDIWQLSLRFGYTLPDGVTENGNRWCADLDALPEFEAFLLSSPVVIAYASEPPQSVNIIHFCAG